jgi:glutamine synthetase
VPNVRGESTRIELRSPDPSANPYLAIAACLKAGLDGIKNKIEPDEEVKGNINAISEEEARELGIEKLPTDLYEACMAMEKDKLVKEVMGERVYELYRKAKLDAWKEYDSQVTNWEIESYLYKI